MSYKIDVPRSSEKDEFELEIIGLLRSLGKEGFGVLSRTNLCGDLDIVFFDYRSFRQAAQFLKNRSKQKNYKIIRIWNEPNKSYLLILHESGKLYGFDLMSGYVVSGCQLATPDFAKILFQESRLNEFSLLKKNLSLSKKARILNKYYVLLNMLSNKALPWFVFLGPDGAGKSTIINLALEDVKASRVMNIRSIHLREPIFTRGSAATKNESGKKPHGQRIRSRVMSVVKLVFLFFHYWFTFTTKQYASRKSGSLVVFDRYIYDLVYDNKRFGVFPFGGFFEWYVKFFPKPDVVFIITAEPATIVSRKDDLDLQSASLLVKSYRDRVVLGSSTRPEVIQVDSEVDLSESVGFVKSAIFKKLWSDF